MSAESLLLGEVLGGDAPVTIGPGALESRVGARHRDRGPDLSDGGRPPQPLSTHFVHFSSLDRSGPRRSRLGAPGPGPRRSRERRDAADVHDHRPVRRVERVADVAAREVPVTVGIEPSEVDGHSQASVSRSISVLFIVSAPCLCGLRTTIHSVELRNPFLRTLCIFFARPMSPPRIQESYQPD